MSKDPGPLEGVRVLDLSAVIAGPSCAKYLADHGADVIKLERFPNGDISRHSFTRSARGRSPMFMQHNAGKKGLCIDIRDPRGLAVVKALVPKVDVVIEAFTPGVAERLGFGYEALCELKEDIILCSISGFGQTGSHSRRPGYAHISHSMTGWLASQFLYRDPPEQPRGPGIAVSDVVAGVSAFGAICAALFKHGRTGKGEHVDIALFDTLFAVNDFASQASLLGEPYEVWYHPVHKTRDGYVTANVGPDFRGWANLCKAMGREDLLEDPRFSDQKAVHDNIHAAGAEVSAWMATKDSEAIEKALTAHHVACGIVYDIDEAVRQPQVVERDLVATVEDPVRGEIKTMSSAFKYRNARTGTRSAAPTLGQHNELVLKKWLGYTDEQVAELRDANLLGEGEL